MPAALPLSLTRQTLRTQIDRTEMLLIESKASAAAMSVNNYVRSALGPPERSAGRQTRAECIGG